MPVAPPRWLVSWAEVGWGRGPWVGASLAMREAQTLAHKVGGSGYCELSGKQKTSGGPQRRVC